MKKSVQELKCQFHNIAIRIKSYLNYVFSIVRMINKNRSTLRISIIYIYILTYR